MADDPENKEPGVVRVEVGPHEGKPVVLDDTCYFLPCHSAEDCREIAALLMSQPAQEFFAASIFWDAKRPVTARLLNQLDLEVLARYLGREPVPVRTGQYYGEADEGGRVGVGPPGDGDGTLAVAEAEADEPGAIA